jgi:hypothetical protein
MGLNLSSKKKEPKVVEPELLDDEAPEEDKTGEDKEKVWIDEIMVRKQSFDLEPANQMFAKIHKYVDEMAKQADAHKVIDKSTMTKAIGMGTQAKQYINKVEKTRVEVKAPYLMFGRKLDALSTGVQKRLEAIQESLREKIRPIMIAEKAKEKKALKDAEVARKKAEKDVTPPDATPGFERQNVPAPMAPPTPSATTGGAIQTASGSADLVKNVTWTVQDITKVPAEYLTVIASKVNKDAKAGKKIPGIKIKVTDEVSMKAAKS